MQSAKQGKNEPKKAWLVHLSVYDPARQITLQTSSRSSRSQPVRRKTRAQAHEHIRDEADKSQLVLTELLLLGSFCKNLRSFMLLAAARFPSQADLVFHHRQRK